MHPASTASLRVASSSSAVMKMTGHFDPDAVILRRSSNSRNSPEVDVEQQAGCRLHAVALEQRLGRRERPAVDAVARQQPRHALQNARIVIDHDHDCRLRQSVSVSSPGAYVPPGCWPTLIWINGI